MCIGAPLAMLELRAALCVLLREFSFQLVDDAHVDAKVVSTMLGPVSPIRARVLASDQLPVPVNLSGSINQLVHLPAAGDLRGRDHAA